MGDEEGDGADARKGRKGRKRLRAAAAAAASAPEDALESRLAAFGEAFMDSIEEAEVLPRKPRKARQEALAPFREPAGGQAASKRKKNKKKNKQSQTPPEAQGAGAGASAPAAAAGKPASEAPPKVGAGAGAGAAAAGGKKQGSLDQGGAAPGKRPSEENAPRPQPLQRPGSGISAAEKRRFMSGKISDIRSEGRREDSSGRRRRGGDPEDDAEFNKTLKEVLDFVVPNLDKNSRKQYEEAKIRALGGTVDKRQKVNYAHMQRVSKRLEAERQEKVWEDKLLGVTSHVSNHRMVWEVDKLRKQKKQDLKDKMKRRNDGLLRLGMGAYEKKGMATISERAIQSLKRKSGKR